MRCPACTGPTVPQQTVPAERRSDGRVYRVRRCRDPQCGVRCTTLETYHSEVMAEDQAQGRRPRPQPAIPIASPAPMFDLAGERVRGLPPAVSYILDAVRPGTTPDKIKLDAAKWLVDDRRRWRIQAAADANRAGTTPADPAMAQLAQILQLLPDEASA